MDLFLKTFLSVLLYFLKMFISCRSVYIYVLKKSFKRWYFSLDSPSQDKCMLMQITFFNFDSFLIIIGNLLLFFFIHLTVNLISHYLFDLPYYNTTIPILQCIISFKHPKPIKLQSIHACPALWLIFCKTLVKKIVY